MPVYTGDHTSHFIPVLRVMMSVKIAMSLTPVPMTGFFEEVKPQARNAVDRALLCSLTGCC